jgi:hypothetical protein
MFPIPPTRTAATAGERAMHPYAILDHYSLPNCAGYSGAGFDVIQKIPSAFQTNWASAYGQALEALNSAIPSTTPGPLSVERRTKILFLLPFLPRKPPGISRLRTKQEAGLLAQRFGLWIDPTSWPELLSLYDHGITRLRQTFPRNQSPLDDPDLAKVTGSLALLGDSQHAKARKALLSTGMVSSLDNRVQSQMAAKHPKRKAAIPPMTPEQLSQTPA